MTGSASGPASRAILAGIVGGLALVAPAALGQEAAPGGPLVDLAAQVAEHGAAVAVPGTSGADGPLDGVVAARLRLADNELMAPRDRVFFHYDYFDNVRLAAPVTPRDVPGFERSFLDSVALRIPVAADPLLLTGARDEFGPYFVVPPGPVYEGGGPNDPNFGKNRGINAYRGPEGWVIYSTVFDGAFHDEPTGTFAYLMPDAVLMIIPLDEVTGWDQVTIRSPDDAVDVDVSSLPELVVSGVDADGDLLIAGGDEEIEEEDESPTTTTPTTVPTTEPPTANETTEPTETGGMSLLPILLVIAVIGLAGAVLWWLRGKPREPAA